MFRDQKSNSRAEGDHAEPLSSDRAPEEAKSSAKEGSLEVRLKEDLERDRRAGFEDASSSIDTFGSTIRLPKATPDTASSLAVQQQREFEALGIATQEKERRKRGLRGSLPSFIRHILEQVVDTEVEKILAKIQENSKGGLTSDPDVLAQLCEEFTKGCTTCAPDLFIRTDKSVPVDELQDELKSEGATRLMSALQSRYGDEPSKLGAWRTALGLGSEPSAGLPKNDPTTDEISIEISQPIAIKSRTSVPAWAERILTVKPAHRSDDQTPTPEEIVAARVVVEALAATVGGKGVSLQTDSVPARVDEYVQTRNVSSREISSFMKRLAREFVPHSQALDVFQGRGLASSNSDQKNAERHLASVDSRDSVRDGGSLTSTVGEWTSSPDFIQRWCSNTLSQYAKGELRDPSGRPSPEVYAALGSLAELYAVQGIAASDRGGYDKSRTDRELSRLRGWRSTAWSDEVRRDLASFAMETASGIKGIDPRLREHFVREFVSVYEGLGEGRIPPYLKFFEVLGSTQQSSEAAAPAESALQLSIIGKKAEFNPLEGLNRRDDRPLKIELGTTVRDTPTALPEAPGRVDPGRTPDFIARAVQCAAESYLMEGGTYRNSPLEVAEQIAHILEVPPHDIKAFTARRTSEISAAIVKSSERILSGYRSQLSLEIAGRNGDGVSKALETIVEANVSAICTEEKLRGAIGVVALNTLRTTARDARIDGRLLTSTEVAALERGVAERVLARYLESALTEVRASLLEGNLVRSERILNSLSINRALLQKIAGSDEKRVSEIDGRISSTIRSWQCSYLDERAKSLDAPKEGVRALLGDPLPANLTRYPHLVGRHIDLATLERSRTIFASADTYRAANRELKFSRLRVFDSNVRRSGESVRESALLPVDELPDGVSKYPKATTESLSLAITTRDVTLPDLVCSAFGLSSWEQLGAEHFILFKESAVQMAAVELNSDLTGKLIEECDRCAALVSTRNLISSSDLLSLPKGTYVSLSNTSLGLDIRRHALTEGLALLEYSRALEPLSGEDERRVNEMLKVGKLERESCERERARVELHVAMGRAAAVIDAGGRQGFAGRALEHVEESRAAYIAILERHAALYAANRDDSNGDVASEARRRIDSERAALTAEMPRINMRLASLYNAAGKSLSGALSGEQSDIEAAGQAYRYFTRAMQLASGQEVDSVVIESIEAPEKGSDGLVAPSDITAAKWGLLREAGLGRAQLVARFPKGDPLAADLVRKRHAEWELLPENQRIQVDAKGTHIDRIPDPAGARLRGERSVAGVDADIKLARTMSRYMADVARGERAGEVRSDEDRISILHHTLRAQLGTGIAASLPPIGEAKRDAGLNGPFLVAAEPILSIEESADRDFFSAMETLTRGNSDAVSLSPLASRESGVWIECGKLISDGHVSKNRDFMVDTGYGVRGDYAARVADRLLHATPAKRDEAIRLLYEHSRQVLSTIDPARPDPDTLSRAFSIIQVLDSCSLKGAGRAGVYSNLLYAEFVLSTGDVYKVNPWAVDVFANTSFSRDVFGTLPSKGESVDHALDVSKVFNDVEARANSHRDAIARIAPQLQNSKTPADRERILGEVREYQRLLAEDERFATEIFERQFDAYMQLATRGTDKALKERAALKVQELRRTYEARVERLSTSFDRSLEQLSSLEAKLPELKGSSESTGNKDLLHRSKAAIHERLARMCLEEAIVLSHAGKASESLKTIEYAKRMYGEHGSRMPVHSVIRHLDEFEKQRKLGHGDAFLRQLLSELNSQDIGEVLVYGIGGAVVGGTVGFIVTLGQPAGAYAGAMLGSALSFGFIKTRSLYRGWGRAWDAGVTGMTDVTLEESVFNGVALGLDLIMVGGPLKGAWNLGRTGAKTALNIGTKEAARELASGVRLATKEALEMAGSAGVGRAPLEISEWQARRQLQSMALKKFADVTATFGGKSALFMAGGMATAPVAIEWVKIETSNLSAEEKEQRYWQLVHNASKSAAVFATFYGMRLAAKKVGGSELPRAMKGFIATLPAEIKKETETRVAAAMRRASRTVIPPSPGGGGSKKAGTDSNKSKNSSIRSSSIDDGAGDGPQLTSEPNVRRPETPKGISRAELDSFLASEVPDTVSRGRYRSAQAEAERVHAQRGFITSDELSALKRGEIPFSPGENGRPVSGADLERFLYEGRTTQSKEGSEIYRRLAERAERRGFLYEREIAEARSGRFVPDAVVQLREAARLDSTGDGSGGSFFGDGGGGWEPYFDWTPGGGGAANQVGSTRAVGSGTVLAEPPATSVARESHRTRAMRIENRAAGISAAPPAESTLVTVRVPDIQIGGGGRTTASQSHVTNASRASKGRTATPIDGSSSSPSSGTSTKGPGRQSRTPLELPDSVFAEDPIPHTSSRSSDNAPSLSNAVRSSAPSHKPSVSGPALELPQDPFERSAGSSQLQTSSQQVTVDLPSDVFAPDVKSAAPSSSVADSAMPEQPFAGTKEFPAVPQPNVAPRKSVELPADVFAADSKESTSRRAVADSEMPEQPFAGTNEFPAVPQPNVAPRKAVELPADVFAPDSIETTSRRAVADSEMPERPFAGTKDFPAVPKSNIAPRKAIELPADVFAPDSKESTSRRAVADSEMPEQPFAGTNEFPAVPKSNGAPRKSVELPADVFAPDVKSAAPSSSVADSAMPEQPFAGTKEFPAVPKSSAAPRKAVELPADVFAPDSIETTSRRAVADSEMPAQPFAGTTKLPEVPPRAGKAPKVEVSVPKVASHKSVELPADVFAPDAKEVVPRRSVSDAEMPEQPFAGMTTFPAVPKRGVEESKSSQATPARSVRNSVPLPENVFAPEPQVGELRPSITDAMMPNQPFAGTVDFPPVPRRSVETPSSTTEKPPISERRSIDLPDDVFAPDASTSSARRTVVDTEMPEMPFAGTSVFPSAPNPEIGRSKASVSAPKVSSHKAVELPDNVFAPDSKVTNAGRSVPDSEVPEQPFAGTVGFPSVPQRQEAALAAREVIEHKAVELPDNVFAPDTKVTNAGRSVPDSEMPEQPFAGTVGFPSVPQRQETTASVQQSADRKAIELPEDVFARDVNVARVRPSVPDSEMPEQPFAGTHTFPSVPKRHEATAPARQDADPKAVELPDNLFAPDIKVTNARRSVPDSEMPEQPFAGTVGFPSVPQRDDPTVSVRQAIAGETVDLPDDVFAPDTKVIKARRSVPDAEMPELPFAEGGEVEAVRRGLSLERPQPMVSTSAARVAHDLPQNVFASDGASSTPALPSTDPSLDKVQLKSLAAWIVDHVHAAVAASIKPRTQPLDHPLHGFAGEQPSSTHGSSTVSLPLGRRAVPDSEMPESPFAEEERSNPATIGASPLKPQNAPLQELPDDVFESERPAAVRSDPLPRTADPAITPKAHPAREGEPALPFEVPLLRPQVKESVPTPLRIDPLIRPDPTTRPDPRRAAEKPSGDEEEKNTSGQPLLGTAPKEESKAKGALHSDPSPFPQTIPQPSLPRESMVVETSTTEEAKKRRKFGWSFTDLEEEKKKKRPEESKVREEEVSTLRKRKERRIVGKRVRRALLGGPIGSRVVEEADIPRNKDLGLTVSKITNTEGQDG